MREGTPRPFLKWVGGKRQLLPRLLEAVEGAGSFRQYHEPFLGGGALFFALARKGLPLSNTYLSDINPNLIDAYEGLRQNVGGVIRLLKIHERRHCKEYFYQVRKKVPKTRVGRAARVIYLNKTCFNGLYRENSKGEFNAPLGSYENPRICDEENLRRAAETLQDVNMEARDFLTAKELVEPGDLVYFDPPYDPVSKTSAFTDYAKGGFGVDSQEALAQTFMSLAQKGAHIILSNSLTPLTEELYKDFYIRPVSAKRLVNSRADRRGVVAEVLVTTFPTEGASRARLNGDRCAAGGMARLDCMLTKQWLIQNDYRDVANLIDEVVQGWNNSGKQPRRNWWEVLAGTASGKPRTVAGREFPVLRAARIRQGLPMTPDAVHRSEEESPPPIKSTGRWSK